MRFERLTNSSEPMFLTAMDIYWSCFGLPAQREYLSQCNIMDEADYRFELIMEGGEMTGLLLAWEQESFIYVEHLCVAQAFRGRGLAAAALETLAAEGKTIILEADATKGQAEYFVRRGFDINGFDHTHPSYHMMFPGRNLTVMSYPYPLSDEEYGEFNDYLINTVMAQ